MLQSESAKAADAPLPPAAAREVDFARDIQPILTSRCVSCHGAEKHRGGLRLHRRADAQAGGDSGAAYVPGKSAESRLIQLVAGVDADNRMPPEGDLLSAEQVGLLRAWIDQGAKWPEAVDPAGSSGRTGSNHWAFQPVRRVEPPAVQNAAWIGNEIDRFVLARLEQEKIAPSPAADRVTLIRRLSFDLLGLPPTQADVAAFVADSRPDAYEQLVEKFLSSPHYGERWARHWLDAARYGDSDGYNFDGPRAIWKYRDWVIDALNRDLPFDQFTLEQIAGDLLPGATAANKVATGFHRNTLANIEGGVDPEEDRVARVIDRVNTTGTVFLGLTVGCAECHSHKYDPLSQREFYQLYAFFNSSEEPTLELPTSEETALREQLRLEKERVQAELAVHDQRAAAKQPEWEQRAATWSNWTVLEPVSSLSAGGATLTKQPDHSLLAGGTLPQQETYTLIANTPLTEISAFRLEVLTDDSLPKTGPGRSPNGDFLLTGFRVEASPLGNPALRRTVELTRAVATKGAKDTDAALALDGNPQTGWSVDQSLGNQPRRVLFETKDNIGFPEGTTLTITLEHAGTPHSALGRFRLSAARAVRPIELLPKNTEEALAAASRTQVHQKLLVEEFQKQDAERQPFLTQLAELKKREPAVATTLVMGERPQPRPTHVHLRGNFLRPGDAVVPNVPEVLPPLAATNGPPTRLDLARWLIAPENPLTARVTVNRLWQAYFGVGLVETENDFGTQGSPPTHPELLDWLASEFMARNWSLKSVHRLIVTSATYRQTSLARTELASVDPHNLLLARQARFRLDAEIVRDAALAVSGLLVPAVGGPSVFPFQPEGVMDLRRSKRPWTLSEGGDRYRRGLYTHLWRTSPHPFLMAFDAPKSDAACTRRSRSNTPLQALMLLNEQPFVECARGLATSVLSAGLADDPARAEWAFRECVSRAPTSTEQTILNSLIAEQLQAWSADTEGARQLAGPTLPPGATTEQFAAWTALGRVLLNLDEFITRE